MSCFCFLGQRKRMYIFRGAALRKAGALLFAAVLILMLFKFYHYTQQLNQYKPSKEFLEQLNIKRSKDSQLSARKPDSHKHGAHKEHHKPILITPVPLSIEEDPQPAPGLAGKIGPINGGDEAPGLLSNQNQPHLDYDNKQVPPGYRREQGEPQDAREIDRQGAEAKGKDVVNPKGAVPDAREMETIPRDAEQEARDSIKPSQHKPPDMSNIMLPRVDTQPKKEMPPPVPGTEAQCYMGRNRAKEEEWIKKSKDTSSQSSPEDTQRADKVKEMMIHAWSNYRKYAWGGNELDTEVKRATDGIFSGSHMGLTIVDSLDTLWMMGLFEEVEAGKQWMKANLTKEMEKNFPVSVFEFNIRYVGGLLSMYALTNECEYKQLALDCVNRLVPAFNTSSGIPTRMVNLKHGESLGFTGYDTSVLAEVGTLHLEFVYASHISGNIKYKKLVDNLRERLAKASELVSGLYSNTVHIQGQHFLKEDLHVSLGGAGDSFYEYLYKAYLQSGGTDIRAKQLYFDAMQAIFKAGMLKTSFSGLKYFGQRNSNGQVSESMEHLTCFIGGLMAVSAEESQNRTATLQLAEELGKTCHESYIRTPSRIGPEQFYMMPGREALPPKGGNAYYILRPETVETWFFLQRVTHKKMYRDWAWDFIQALEKYCRRPHGFSGLSDVMLERRNTKGEYLVDGQQQSFFLAETLKYLYLIFKGDDLLPLKDWVFNTEAHPLPVLRPG